MLTIILLLVLLLLLGVLITFLARGTPVREVTVIGDGESMGGVRTQEFRDASQMLTQLSLTPTHRVELLCNGDELFERLFTDLQAARSLITWHVFWFRAGRIADRVQDILGERARAGVRVLMLLDHYGTGGLSARYVDSLRESGVQVEVFRPPRWNTLYKAQHRMHVRSVIIDGMVGYTGGFGIDDRWIGDGRHRLEWRDTNVRVQGTAVAQLQGAFASNWGEASGELIVGDDAFPFAVAASGGHQRAGILFSAPSYGSTNAERFFILSIAGARERFWLTSAYFIPNRALRKLMCGAVQRGVDVRVLTPGANTDRRSTWYAARARYEELLEGGVRIYEYRPTMVHAKSMVADGIWTMVGTLNCDNRSLVLNDEVALVAWDEALGAQLEQVFVEDLEYAEEVRLDDFRERSKVARAKERAADVVSRVL